VDDVLTPHAPLPAATGVPLRARRARTRALPVGLRRCPRDQLLRARAVPPDPPYACTPTYTPVQYGRVANDALRWWAGTLRPAYCQRLARNGTARRIARTTQHTLRTAADARHVYDVGTASNVVAMADDTAARGPATVRPFGTHWRDKG